MINLYKYLHITCRRGRINKTTFSQPNTTSSLTEKWELFIEQEVGIHTQGRAKNLDGIST